MELRRTKIIATLGPATDHEDKMCEMIAAGVDLVRLNFSHGSFEEHKKRVDLVRAASAKLKKEVGLLADLQGPKIRISKFKDKKIELKNGNEFVLDAEMDPNSGDEEQVGIDYKNLPHDVTADDMLLLDDGRIHLKVKKVVGAKIVCEVQTGGELSSNKGINRKGGGLSAPALTEKDKEDIKSAIKLDVHYLAVSFPRSAEDIEYARSLVEAQKGKLNIIAKIERTEAVENIEEIIKASDAVMVARGDLAVEIGDAEVPGVQKMIIERCRALNTPVITATQMMESMTHTNVPTRAEVSDVANAVLDLSDAVMLSAESAVGSYPALVVETMHRICLAAERHPSTQISAHRVECEFERVDEAIAMATVYTANHMDIKAIICLTESGSTPLWMSRIRTGIPIFALSRHAATRGKMTLYRDVYSLEFDVTKLERKDVNRGAIDTLQREGYVQDGDLVILTKGEHMGIHGGTNAMKVLMVGEVK